MEELANQAFSLRSAAPGTTPVTESSGSLGGGQALRVMAYCHDSVGLGHFHRTLAICELVRRVHPQSTFLLVTGTPYVPIFNLPHGVDYVKLPALVKGAEGSYRGKYLTTSTERVMHCRKALLRSAAEAFDPSVLLVDKAPAGVCGELLPTLRWLRQHRRHTRIVLGMRDIEDEPRRTIAQWTSTGALQAMQECYDEIWVYGMRSIFDVSAAYRLSECIRHKLRFLGYVVQDPCCHDLPRRTQGGGVLVTVGGGTDGELVLKTYLAEAAERISHSGFSSTIVGGPDLPAQTAHTLRGAASRIPAVEWLDFAPCMNCRIRQAGVVVSMGGYNTLCEVVSNHRQAVVIPRTTPRLEQAIRARLWSRKAGLEVIAPEELTPRVLADRVVTRLEKGPRTSASGLDFGGLDRVCERFDMFIKQERRRAATVRM
jgi:predicted glycosyltransferase